MDINNKFLDHAYGYDDVSIVPGEFTINPELADTKFKIQELEFDIPVLASAMDAVVSPEFAINFNSKGGLAVLNLEGIYTKYNDYTEPLESVISAKENESTTIMQKVYLKDIDEDEIYQPFDHAKTFYMNEGGEWHSADFHKQLFEE